MRESGNTEALEAIAYEECDQVGELLGIAFVACQAFINRVWNQVHDLNETCLREYGRPLPSVTSRQEVLQVEGSRLAGSSITNIEAIYAVGNYWKHSEEWPTCGVAADGCRRFVWDTSKMQPIQKSTAEVVLEMGLRFGSTGNLRTAARILGASDCADLGAIRRTLDSWAKQLLNVDRAGVEQLAGQSSKQKH